MFSNSNFSKPFLFVLLWTAHTAVFSSPGTRDSLESALAQATDTSRVLLLNELAYKYLAYQPKTAKAFADESLILARRLEFLAGEAAALNRLGDFLLSHR